MQEHKEELIAQAVEEHGMISPAGDNTKLEDSFTVDRENLIFWFNPQKSETGTTRALVKKLSN